MLVNGSLLAQTTAASGSIYTAALRTTITRLVICNTGSATTFRLYHDDDGTTFDASTALYWDQPIGANETLVISAESPSEGFMVAPGGAIGLSTAGTLTTTLYGVTADVA